MSDLAKRLRGEGDAHFRGMVRDRRTIGAMLNEAAEEIERLLTENKELRDDLYRHGVESES